jgi:hypothetical protein
MAMTRLIIGAASLLVSDKHGGDFQDINQSTKSSHFKCRRDFFGIAGIRAALLTTFYTTQTADAMGTSMIDEAVSLSDLRTGFTELVTLNNNYDLIIRSGADSVRRRLGSVGTTSPLFAIEKKMSLVRIFFESMEDEGGVDLEKYIESSIEVLAGLREIDFLAYSSIFSDNSGNAAQPGMTSKDFEEKTRVAIQKTIPLYSAMLESIKLKPEPIRSL